MRKRLAEKLTSGTIVVQDAIKQEKNIDNYAYYVRMSLKFYN